MPEDFRQPFFNPYVDEASDEARFSTFVTMDEAHERWNNGSWHADKTNFELGPAMFADGRGLKLDESGRSTEPPRENRFAFDLQRDIINADQQSSHLDDSAYTSNDRPQGSIGSTLSNLTIDRLRYNALAGIQEELPEDLSYLYGTSETSRPRRREVRLRTHRCLETPVDQRRAEVERMLPEEAKESPEAIMADIRRRRDIEDAKSGIDSSARKKAPPRGIYEYHSPDGSDEDFYTAEEHYDIEGMTERGSWRAELPQQDGLVPDSRELPYFGRFSRNWSEIDPIDPDRSDMLRHTVNTIYEDDVQVTPLNRFRSHSDSRDFYVPDDKFNPDDRYHQMYQQRRNISAEDDVLTQSIMSGSFSNPYIDISSDRLKYLINHDMRGPGQVAEPEGLTDPALMYEWNMGYSRVNSRDNNYSAWMEEQNGLAEMAQQSRYRSPHRTGRPGAYLQRETPYGSERKYPRGNYTEHERRRTDLREQLQRATEQGIADGREILRHQQKARRDAERECARRLEEERRRAYDRQRQAYEQQMQAYRRQQEQMTRQDRRPEPASRRGQPPAGARKPALPRPSGPQQMQVRKPQYGPMGFYTPKAGPQDSSRSGERPRRRR